MTKSIRSARKQLVIGLAMLVMVTLSARIVVGEGASGGSTPSLFSTFQGKTTGNDEIEHDDWVIRRRAVEVNSDLLDACRRGEIKNLRLNLFDDVVLEAVIERTVIRSPQSYSLIGSVNEEENSRFILTVKNNIMIGNIRTSDGHSYRVRHPKGLFHETREINTNKLSFICSTGQQDVTLEKGESFPAPLALLQNCTGGDYDDGSTFDVLVVYTQAAKEAEGGTAEIEALIDLAIDETNDGYDNSDITPNMHLVHQQEVDYTESYYYSTDLNILHGTSDGYIDEVHSLRDYYYADLVIMIVEHASNEGLAYGIPDDEDELESFAEDAFCLVDHDIATGIYVFGHELGHLMGGAHETASPDLYPYSHGYQFSGDPSGTTYATVMVSGPGSGGGGRTRIDYYANLDVDYDGTATGDADTADNARSIDNAAYTISNWRSEAPHVMTTTVNETLVFYFDEQGNFIIEGNLQENATVGQLTPSEGDMWIIENNLDSVVVRVDSNGDMYLDGSIDSGLSCPLTPTNDILIMKNADDGPVAYIDNDGNMKLTGSALIWKHGSP